jgi:hypothetical protein
LPVTDIKELYCFLWHRDISALLTWEIMLLHLAVLLHSYDNFFLYFWQNFVQR